MSSPAQQPSLREDVVRVAVLVYPKPGITFEKFSHYWLTQHGPLFASLEIVKKNLLKYEQVHFDLEKTSSLAAQGLTSTGAWGMAVVEAESYEKIAEIYNSAEFLEKIIPDEANVLERAPCVAVVGKVAQFIGK